MPHDRKTDLPQLPIASFDKNFIETLKGNIPHGSLVMGPPPTSTQRIRILRVYLVSRQEHGQKKFSVFRSWEEVESEFDGAELGDSITVTLQSMTQEQLDALPDFEGW